MNNPTVSKQKRARMATWLLIGTFVMIWLVMNLLAGSTTGNLTAKAQSPTPTLDRLAEPALSENPSQYEDGRYLYWMNCMPCHGDFGQGLTDEFRELWVEDHQNCWGRGCHGGRQMDEGFPIPRDIPAVISTTGKVLAFTNPDQLYEYLHTTHPPQSPGYLPEEEYWAMTAYVLAENNLLSSEKEIGPYARKTSSANILLMVSIGLVFLIVGIVVVWARRIRETENAHSH